jgi:hypothetical protein
LEEGQKNVILALSNKIRVVLVVEKVNIWICLTQNAKNALRELLLPTPKMQQQDCLLVSSVLMEPEVMPAPRFAVQIANSRFQMVVYIISHH